ncbi:DUF2637 domain-containing protein [Streptomyces sp. NPDC007172]|uniref:DUF2637 domain-containing protein n=1 Tax=Streptomyces sp. NPDC007172 TaxID=3364776 RepID=UPI0036D0918F
MNRSIRLDAVLVQAVIAGALSFAHLHDLALAAGQGGWKAWAYPVSVDLLLVASWRRLRSAGPSRLAWSWFLIALSASLGANVATAGLLDLQHPPFWLRFGIAGWPALAFLGGTLLAHTASGAMPEAPLPNPSADSVAEPHAPGPAPDPQPVDQPVRTDPPDLPTASPVPAALVDHARKLAADHRARTGSALDADALRARLGVPAQLAEAIAAQLA